MQKKEAYDIIADFSEKSSNPDDFEFTDFSETVEKTATALKQYPELAKYIDSDFVYTMKNHYDGHFALAYTQIFSQIMRSKNSAEQVIYLQKLEGANPFLLEDLENCAVEQNPDLLDDVFNKRLQYIYEKDNLFIPQLMNLVIKAPTAEKCEKMLQKAFGKIMPVAVHNKNMTQISQIYHKYPQLLDRVFEIIKKEKNSKRYLEALTGVALFDDCKAEDVLCLMRDRVEQGPRDEYLLQKYYANLKTISDEFPRFKLMAQDFGRNALNFKENNKNCKKLAARLLEDEEVLLSNISVGEKTKVSRANPYGYKKVGRIDNNETSVLFIGGNGSLDDRAAHGYIKPVVELIKRHKMGKKVNVYGLSYDFGDYFNLDQALDAQMKKYGHKTLHREENLKNMHKDTVNPQFIEQIFRKFILPRISLLDGRVKTSTDNAARNMNKLKIVAHCFGGYVALKLEEMTMENMSRLGYSPEEQKLIIGQMQVIAMNPYCPLGVQKSDMFSLISAQDRTVTHNNFFEKYIRHQVNIGKTVPLCYFEKKLGNFVLINKMYGSDNRRNIIGDENEHGYFGMAIHPYHTENGKIALTFMQNALIKGLKSALRDEIRTLSTSELLTSSPKERKNFAIASENGKKLFAQALEYTIAENNKIFNRRS